MAPATNSRLKILLVEDLPSDAELVLKAITGTGVIADSIRVDNPEDLRKQLLAFNPDIVLSDYSMPRLIGMEALRIVREHYSDLPFIFVSGTIGEESASDAIKAGATDYVLKDHLTRLPDVVARALNEVQERRARRTAEQQLSETRERLESILGSLHDAVWSVAVPDEHVLYNNRGMEFIYGRPAADFVKNSTLWREVIHPGDLDMVTEAWKNIYAHELFDHEYRILRPDGSVRWVRDWARTHRDDTGQVVRIDGITSDITERKLAEQALARRNDLYEMLSQVNQAIVHAASRNELFPKVCRIVVEHGHLRFASITLLDSSIDQYMRPVASYGDDKGYVQIARIARHELDLAGQGPTGQAMRTGTHAISNDFLNDYQTVPWHALAERAGVRASAAFPLRSQNKSIGTINLYAGEPGFFNTETLQTFDEIAMDVSFAIDNYQREAERRSSEARFHVTVESAPNALIMTNVHGVMILVNTQAENLFGYSRDKLLGQSIEMLVPVHSQARHVVLRDVFASKPGARAMGAGRDLLGLRSDGTEVPIEIGLSCIEGAEGVSVLASIVDISERRRSEAELRHSEERFRSLVEATSQIVWHADANGKDFSYSPSFEKITGIDGASMSDWGWLQSIHPDDRERLAADWQSAVKSGKLYTNEYRQRMRDGIYRWFDVRALPILNKDNSIREWIGTCTDIHDRLIAERESRDTRRRYQELVDEALEGIYMRSAEGRFLFVNPAFCQMLGYDQYTLLQMQVQDILDLKDPEVKDFLHRVIEGKELQALQSTRLKRQDGLWVDALATVKRLPDGRVQGMVLDVTQRRQAERKLAEEQKFIVTSLDSVPGIFYVFDNQGIPLRWNKNFEAVTGYDSQQIQHMQVLEFIAVEHRSTIKERIEETFIKGESIAEAELLTRGGRRIPYYFSGRKFQWQGKSCLVGMGVDISDRQLAERRVQEYLAQTQRLSQELLKAQDQERRRIAHELHDEVGAMLSALQISLHKSLQEAPAKLKQSLQDDLAMIVNLLSQVRKLSLDLRPSVLDDLGLLPAVRWYMREHLKKTDLSVQLDVPRSLPRLTPEIENACFRVLQGAATNVLRHAHARTLSVQLKLANGLLEMNIRDDGKGFDVEAAQTLARGGASLGLLAMEERVRLVGGEFILRSTPGHGTDVQVRINTENTTVK